MFNLKKTTAEELAELEIKMFNALAEAGDKLNESEDKDYPINRRHDLYNEYIKLKKEFERLANKADGIAEVRRPTKGAAYSLAQYYLNEYPTGSLTVTSTAVPSLFNFSKELESKIIETQSGPLEIERVGHSTSIEMAINGNISEEYTLSMLKTGFTRAKRDIKK
ncbi:hypothetical protein [Shewanella sp. CAL98-MNA-CIBAN-0140]|uniref:hypothetical protein n=1 Tax=unclassified Shewanella TaxID=196818 RepID=UPI0033180DB3